MLRHFLEKLMVEQGGKPLISHEYFSADGTLLQAWTTQAALERNNAEKD